MAGNALKTHPAAAVFIMDPEQTPLAKSQVLAKLYNLTPAEARLATALASGMSTKHYAERSSLSIHYVRWLLKQIEAKTDTRRIADLIRLLASQTGFFGMGSKDD
jgi:DNA-binding CsgD family transcriptional regulator